MGFLQKIFGSQPRHRLCGYWCETEVRLSRKIATPMGGKVSIVQVCVDIDYDIRDDVVHILRVQMATSGSGIMGSEQAMNMAAPRRGEAWYDRGTIPAAALTNIVADELRANGSRLEQRIRASAQRDAAG